VTAARTSYRLGSSIVLATLLASAAICLATVGDRPSGPTPRAAHSLSANPLRLPPFSLTERSGKSIGSNDTDGRVWIAAFIFTRCPSSCPRISAVMKGLQQKLVGTGVQLVSISVDPERDTPEVLRAYAHGLGADPRHWWFLTGPKTTIHQLVLDGFRVPLRETADADRAAGAEDVAHSARLALVHRGNRVVGYYDSEVTQEVAALVREAAKLDNIVGHQLPSLNAFLNAAAALALALGWLQIRAGRVRAHVACMVTALVLSSLFLVSYLAYHFLIVKGSVPFQGTGKPIRFLYFTILLSHTVLAVALVPLVALTLTRALRRRFDRHAVIAAVTWPIWIYVSLTGVVVYWMLYRLDFPTTATSLAALIPPVSPGDGLPLLP
jgi:protein SCO1/2/putative membrane protein